MRSNEQLDEISRRIRAVESNRGRRESLVSFYANDDGEGGSLCDAWEDAKLRLEIMH